MSPSQHFVVHVGQLARLVSLFVTKLVVPRQIKPRILELSIKRGQSIVFIIIVCYEEKDNYRVVSEGQLGFYLPLVLRTQSPYPKIKSVGSLSKSLRLVLLRMP